MKNIYLLSILFIAESSFSQAPDIEWQNTIGGDGYDWGYSIDQTNDGGYILGGSSESGISDDKTDTSRGFFDFWILKLDYIGNIEWQKTIGGSQSDHLLEIHQTLDGGYICGGQTYSNISGEKIDDQFGGGDYWIVKLDSAGNIEWQKNIGGVSNELCWSIKQVYDGGYIIGGTSSSDISGNKTTSSFGEADFWVIKLDSIGSIQWQKSYGGDQEDLLSDIITTSDHGYLISGHSYSGITGNKSEENLGFDDGWVIKIDSIGNIEWQKRIGGNGYDRIPSIFQTTDSGYILACITLSDPSDDIIEPTLGHEDYLLVKINSLGETEWQNRIGGNAVDWLFAIEQTSSSEFICAGGSFSGVSGDKTESNFGEVDIWVIKTDTAGNIKWQKELGGTYYEFPYEIHQTNDDGYIITSYSASGLSGNKSENNLGLYDYWVVKLFPDCFEFQEICNGIDDDCNGIIDDGLSYNIYYIDFDNDGFGDSDSSIFSCDFFPPAGYVTDSTDCNDLYILIHPDVSEICNLVDDNCNGSIDEDLATQMLYIDQDGDNYGNAMIDTITCFLAITGYVPDSTDCDDTDPLIYPGAMEILDGVDNN